MDMSEIVPRMKLRNEIHHMMKELCRAANGAFEDVDTYWMEKFCDSQCFNEPGCVEAIVGEVFVDRQEAEVFNEVMEVFFSINPPHGQTEGYMADPLWPKLADSAKKMLLIMSTKSM